MKEIPISNRDGVFALVDDDDYDYLSQFIWTQGVSGYIVRSKRRKEQSSQNLSMHRIITECPKGLTVDHINFNKLDNRKENLRIVTREENSAHQPQDKKVQVIYRPKIEKLYPYNRMLTKKEIKIVDEFIKSLRPNR